MEFIILSSLMNLKIKEIIRQFAAKFNLALLFSTARPVKYLNIIDKD